MFFVLLWLLYLWNCSFCTCATSDWVYSFCELPGHELYLKVPTQFLLDPVTQNSVAETLPMGSCNIEILDLITSGELDLSSPLQKRAKRYYDIFHSLYVVSPLGLHDLRQKFEQAYFGQCPRVFCSGAALLPVINNFDVFKYAFFYVQHFAYDQIGLHDKPKKNTVKLFCPKCRDLYHPQNLKHRYN